MTATTRQKIVVAALAAAVVLPVSAATVPASARAAAQTDYLPGVRIIGITDHATWVKGHRAIFGEASTYVGTRGGSWELWAQRPSYRDSITLSQVVRDAHGDVVIDQPLPDIAVDELGQGLANFTRATLRNSEGEVVVQRQFDFCPNNYQLQRTNDTGPENPTYPEACWANPFTTGAVWGIDRGWAARSTWGVSIRKPIPVGSYHLRIAISSPYREQFHVAKDDATVRMTIEVVRGSSSRTTARTSQAAQSALQPTTLTRAANLDPGPRALPDLVSLPAWGMSVQNRPRVSKSYLSFGATVWNRGPSPLVVEGFRESNAQIMKAYQYFYRDGERVGKTSAGTLEYDSDRGHQHWHFQDFASYSLLASDKSQIVRSGKEAFCLAPTDMIDLTIPDAAMRPFLAGLGTACGEPDSLWIREVLQTGWGDTYTQYRPGQSFNITDLPNGLYFVEVRANPDGRLYEVTDSNNVAFRKIYLKGKPGDRSVVVPPYQGIDTEHG